MNRFMKYAILIQCGGGYIIFLITRILSLFKLMDTATFYQWATTSIGLIIGGLALKATFDVLERMKEDKGK